MPWSPGAARVHALGDVGGLAADGVQDGAGGGVEGVLGAGVADLFDDLADELVDVEHGLRGDLAADDDQAAGDEGLAGDAAPWVFREDGVEDGVGDLVADLVGVALGDRLGIEKVFAKTPGVGDADESFMSEYTIFPPPSAMADRHPLLPEFQEVRRLLGRSVSA